MSKVNVTFLPDNVSIAAEPGTSLLQAALDAGVYIDAACGGAGSCGRCKVLVRSGEVECGAMAGLKGSEREGGLRLACQCRVSTDVVASVTDAARIDRAVIGEGTERTSSKITSLNDLDIEARGWEYSPPVTKFKVKMPPPTLQDNVSDLTRLLRGLKAQHDLHDISADFQILPSLAKTLRDGGWEVTATIAATRVESRLAGLQRHGSRKPKLIRVEPGDTTAEHCFLALDVGTTTMWGQLVDMSARAILATASDYNGQISYGEDVITRIVNANKPGGLEALQGAAVRTINGVIDELLRNSGARRDSIVQIAAAGNTTMTQLLLGLPPRHLREAPYVPTAFFIPPVRARSLGIDVSSLTHIYTFPAVASYVGGDIVAGVLGSGLYRRKELTLYVDIGTNGEIVLGNSDWLVSASCSAGPAFEGGGVRCGVRAMPGAISDFRVDPATCKPMIVTMGQTKPIGICGVGLIAMIAELFEKGILEPNGKFRTDLATDRVRGTDGGSEYLVVEAANSGTGADIVLTEPDIENIVRAKAAMYAGVMTLLDSVGLTIDDIDRVIIAGALGNFLELEKCIVIGLFPDIPRHKFNYIGNGSLLGARLVSLNNEMLDDGERIAHRMTNIELVDNKLFIDNYTSAMFLPHTDIGSFPSVRRQPPERPTSRAGTA